MKLTQSSVSVLLFTLLAFFCILNIPTFLYFKGVLSFKVFPLGISLILLCLIKKYAKVTYELRLYLLFFGAYILIGLLSIVLKDAATEVDRIGAVKNILINFIIMIATYQYVCGISDTTHSKIFKVVIIITLLGVLSIIFSSQLGMDNLAKDNSDDYTRKAGLYLNPNAAGFTAMILMAFAFGNNFKNKTVIMLLYGTALLATFFAASKTSFVTLAVFTLVFLSKYRLRDINIKSIVLASVIGIIAYILLQDYLVGDNYDRVMQLTRLAHGDTSSDVTSSRLDLAKIALGIIADNMLIGQGLYYFTLLPASATHLGYDLGVHNTYLLILGDSGFLPFLLFVLMVISCIRASYKYAGEHYMCYFFVAYAFFASVNHNLFDNSLVAFLLGFSLASLARLHNNEQVQLND